MIRRPPRSPLFPYTPLFRSKVPPPDVPRYFMTIPESVALVLQAAALPEAARRISILEMGKPIRILELAEQLIRLSGLEPYRDISIAFSGLRPGEKLAEELVACAEDTVATSDDRSEEHTSELQSPCNL